MYIPTTVRKDDLKKFNLCECDSRRLDVLGGYIIEQKKDVSCKFEISNIKHSTLITKCRCCSNIYLVDMLERSTMKTDDTEIISVKKISLYEAREIRANFFKLVSSYNSTSISIDDYYLKLDKLDEYKEQISFSLSDELYELYED